MSGLFPIVGRTSRTVATLAMVMQIRAILGKSLKIRVIGVCVVLLSIYGCSSESRCSDIALPPMTVEAVLAREPGKVCGNLSAFGYLRELPANEQRESARYFLVSDSNLLSRFVDEETLGYLGLYMDFSESFYATLPREKCVGEFVVVSGRAGIVNGKTIMHVDDTTSITRIGESIHEACRGTVLRDPQTGEILDERKTNVHRPQKNLW